MSKLKYPSKIWQSSLALLGSVCLSFLLSGSILHGARELYVSPSGNDSGSGTRHSPWKTPEYASRVAQAGDTVIFLPGDYNGHLLPQNSGTAEAPVTFVSAVPGKARLIGHGEGAAFRIAIEGVSHIRIRNFYVEDTGASGWFHLESASHVHLEDNRFQGGKLWAAFRIENSEQIRITGNDFSRRAHSGDMGRVSSSRQLLFERNSFSRSLHSLMMFHLPAGASEKIVVRGNVFHAGWARNLENVGHPDVLVENNIFTNAFNGGHSAGTVNQFQGNRTIIRFNQVFANAGVPWIMSSSSRSDSYSNRIYNNIFSGNLGSAMVLANARSNFGDMILKNNIFADNDPYGSQTALIIHAVGEDRLRLQGNVFSPTEGDDSALILLGKNVVSLEDAQGGDRALVPPGMFEGNHRLEVGFQNTRRFDFSLEEGSPIVGKGLPLTTTTGEGSGTSLPVADSYYFYDGYGIEGEVGDLIAVGEGDNIARIVKVDHGNRILELDRELSWVADAPVSFPWSGEGPTPGLYEVAGTHRPSVQVLVSNATPAEGEEIALKVVPRGIEGPISVNWQLGDDATATGEQIRHRFESGYDYGVRVLVTDASGTEYSGVGYVNAEKRRRGDVYLHTTFDRDDTDWWTYWQFYRGRRSTGYSRYEHILDERTGKGYHHIAARQGKGPLPAFLHPKDWNIDEHPRVKIRYRISPGSPIAIMAMPFPSAYHVTEDLDFRQDTRRFYIAGTSSEPRGNQRLIDDGKWHEITFDMRDIRKEYPEVTMIYALHIGDLEIDGGTKVEPSHEFWLDEIYIGK